MDWDYSKVVDDMWGAIAAREAALALEQAVHGLDALEELALHEVLSEGLTGRYEVQREVPYPSTAGRKRSHRQRCDLVLTPVGRPLVLDWVQPTLFDPPGRTAPQDALWLEVKVAYQFGEGGRWHSGYGTRWRRGVTGDLRKLALDPLVRHAALALVVFTESDEILNKDLGLMQDVLALERVLAGALQVRTAPIADRRGHRVCAVALWPARL